MLDLCRWLELGLRVLNDPSKVSGSWGRQGSKGRAMNPASNLLGAGVLGMVMWIVVAACSGDAPLRGSILIEGSSTAFPITGAVAREFRKSQPEVEITVRISGTGGGFQRFCDGQTVIQDASRPINEQEAKVCAANGVQYIELPTSYDAITVAVHPDNIWATCVTTSELRKMWGPASQETLLRWNQVNSAWPETELRLFAPGIHSGTYDYFTERINGKAGASRRDYTQSEDHNFLVQSVAQDPNALGYVGLAYYLNNRFSVFDKIAASKIDAGRGCVEPSAETVEDNTYPLSRPLFIYVAVESLDRPEVKAFVDLYLENAGPLAASVGYVKLPEHVYGLVRERWESQKLGSMYANAPDGAGLEDLLEAN
jgi:phosphate transport system substrate-binding protein